MSTGYHDSGNVNAGAEASRAECRESMLQLAGGAMKFESRARRVFRHSPSATMVRQLLFWDGKGSDSEGYVWKTYTEWWDEEGLSRTEIDTARRKLGAEGAGVLEEQRKGVPCRLFYRLDLEKLRETMFPELKGPTADDPVPENGSINHYYRVQGSREPVCRDTASKFAGFGPSHYRENQEITSESLPGGTAAAAPPGRTSGPSGLEPVSAKTSPQPVKELPGSSAGEVDGVRGSVQTSEPVGVKRHVARLVKGLKLDDEQAGRYAGWLSALARKGATADELDRVASRIVERWPHIRLRPKQALEDVRGQRSSGKASSPAQPSPPEVLEAIKQSNYFGEAGIMKAERYWELAERFDFAGDAQPQGRDWFALGGTDRERYDHLTRLRSIARRAVREAGVAELEPVGDPAGENGAAKIHCERPEDGLQGSSTPEDFDGPDGNHGAALVKALDQLLADENSKAVRLARAVVAGKKSGGAPITSDNVAAVIAEELDLPALGFEGTMAAGVVASILVRRVQDLIEQNTTTLEV